MPTYSNIFVAKYKQICDGCEQLISIGEEILIKKSNQNVYHIECLPKKKEVFICVKCRDITTT